MRNALDDRKPLKKKPCKVCKTLFQPFNSFSKTCSTGCAIEHVQALRDAAQARQRKEQRKDTRKRKAALKTRSDWLKEAQTAFNAYIRERDKDEVCISCQKPPKKKNCGHYKSVGSHPELRFHPFNGNLQCEHCNTYKSGNQAEYRVHLQNKIGQKNVEWLEGKQVAQHWSIDEIMEIRQYYKDKLKLIKLEG